MIRSRRLLTLLPFLSALAATVIINAIPFVRGFVFQEEAFIAAGWALYFFTVPWCFVQMVVGGLTSAILAFVKSERGHAIAAYVVTALVAVSSIPMLIFVCQAD